jgi:hypothetical protein
LWGAHYQLLVIAVLIVLVSLAAGAVVFTWTPSFKEYGESAWWAFLRLSDPGYLGDDKGVIPQTVSTIVTVLGYVLFMGALIAIMTQWLNSTMKKLESGLTPIIERDHVLILGWTNRTPTIVRELVLSEGRVRRFLRRIGARGLHIVILAEKVTTALPYRLKEELGHRWNRRQITFRSGTPLSIEDLRRVDFMNAGVILLPGSDFVPEGAEMVDTRAVKSLLTISNYGTRQSQENFPLVVAEIFDARKIPIARSAYKGDVELIGSDLVISRLIAQNVRHRGLSYIYSELLTHIEGNELFIREFPQFAGQKFQDLMGVFSEAVLLGVLREKQGLHVPILNPPEGFEVGPEDRMVFMARRYAYTEPSTSPWAEPIERGRLRIIPGKNVEKRLLILGWNHKLPSLIREFESYENERFRIDVISLIPVAQREEYMSRYMESPQRVNLMHMQADYTAPNDLARINPLKYDNVVFVANTWMSSNEESDARTILGYLLLKDMLPKGAEKPEILLELMDPENEKLFQQRTGEVLISPLILSHILAHVALRRDLNVVFEELFTVGGAEIYLQPASACDLVDQELPFGEIGRAVAEKGEIALGVRVSSQKGEPGGGIHLNPAKDAAFRISAGDELVVLSTYS